MVDVGGMNGAHDTVHFRVDELSGGVIVMREAFDLISAAGLVLESSFRGVEIMRWLFVHLDFCYGESIAAIIFSRRHGDVFRGLGT